MKRKPRTSRTPVGAEVRFGDDMVSREDPQSARIEIRTDQVTKDALVARALDAGADSLSAFLLERGAAEPTQREKREWKSRSKEAAAKRSVADAKRVLRDIQRGT